MIKDNNEINQIIYRVLQEYPVIQNINQIFCKDRSRPLSEARHVILFLCRQKFPKRIVSDEYLEHYLNRSHSILWYSIKACNNLKHTDKNFKEMIEKLEKEIITQDVDNNLEKNFQSE